MKAQFPRNLVQAQAINAGLSMAIPAIKNFFSTAGVDSYVEYDKVLRVSPICLLDESLSNQEITPDILQVALSMFTSYYLQAIALNNNKTVIDIVGRLDQLNPERSARSNALNAAEAVANGAMAIAFEELSHTMPVMKKLSLEADDSDAGAKFGSSLKPVVEETNMAIGKNVVVTLQEGNAKMDVPITITLTVLSAIRRTMSMVFRSVLGLDSMKERWMGVKSGRLRLFADFLFGADLRAAQRNTLIEDKSGFYAEVDKRQRGNLMSALLSGKASVGSASNIIILSRDTLKSLEMELGFDFKNPTSRQKIFGATLGMLYYVVDLSTSTVEIWTRGQNLPSRLAFRSIKMKAKEGLNLTDMLRLYQNGQVPSF